MPLKKLKVRTENVINVQDWDAFVKETYKRQYCLQQQDGCHSRGNLYLTVPSEEVNDFENDSLPEIVNHEKMGVSFKSWLARDPNQTLEADQSDFSLELWWDRNFYPSLDVLANDLHSRGLLEAGEYTIKIDW